MAITNIAALELIIIEGDDVPPTVVSKDVLTNDLYGLNLTEATYLNSTNFDETESYCIANDLLVSMVFNGQQSILDVLQYIINHHNGYITYYDGKISHNQLKTETPIADYTDSYIVKEEGANFPLSLTKKGSRDCYNKVTVEYSKREKSYNTGTAIDDDSVDIDNYGLQITTVNLDGLTTFTRAQKMAGLLLRSYLNNPQQLSFKLGPKSLSLKPGDVITYTDEDLELDSFSLRISSINEGKDYQIEVEAQEEKDIYDLINYGTDSSTPVNSPDLYSDASSITNEVLVEIHPNYTEQCALAISSSKPDETQWAGSSLYKSYSSGGTFTKIDTASFSGITGIISNIDIDNSGLYYIDVVFTYDYTFSSTTDLDSLIVSPKTNLFVIQGSYGDLYFRFQDADLISTLTWRFSNLIYNCTEFAKINEVGSIAIGDKFVLYNPTQFFLTLSNTDKHNTLYFKLPSYNFKGTEQSLASISEKSKLISALIDVPLSPYNGKINNIGLDTSNSVTINSGDIDLEFCSRNRKNLYFNTYNVDVPEDSDFVYFQIEIKKSDDTLLRTVTQTTKIYTYTTALQTIDGGPFSDYKFVIKQKNSSEWSSSYTINITLV
jgi:hypothetical protein